jgi:hypothetical protein
MKFRERLTKFFFPAPNSPRWILLLPYITLAVIALVVVFGGVHTWEYTNSPAFCGTACHTMPPQNAAYLESPHANVTCEECHIGRASFVDQAMRKTQGIKETYYEIFKLYKYPIRAEALRPALDTCEKCHRPETFSDDSLRLINHYANDKDNTVSSTYLIMKTVRAWHAAFTGIFPAKSFTTPMTSSVRISPTYAFTTKMGPSPNT